MKRLFALLALVLSAAVGARAQNTLGQRISVVQNAMGLAVPSAQITVCTQNAQITITTTPPFTQPCTPLFPIFSDPAGHNPVTQPLISNGDGNYNYWGTPGSYVQECIEAIQTFTYCQLVQIPGGTSGGGPGTALANQQINFVNQTSVSLATIYGTTALLWDCYDSNSPANAIYPANVSLNTVNFQMIFTFTVPQSGFCVVNGSGGGGAGGGVTSFNTRTGTVVPTTGDYAFGQISGVTVEGQLPATVLFSDQNFTAGAHSYSFAAANPFTVPTLTPSAIGTPLDTAASPFGNLFVGLAANTTVSFNVAALTTNRTWTVPDASGTIAPAAGSWTNGDCTSAVTISSVLTTWADSGIGCSGGALSFFSNGFSAVVGPPSLSGNRTVTVPDANAVWPQPFVAAPRTVLAGLSGTTGAWQLAIQQQCTNVQSATTYTVQPSDFGCVIKISNAANITITVPDAGTGAFTNFFDFSVYNCTGIESGCASGSSTVTVTRTTNSKFFGVGQANAGSTSYTVYAGQTVYNWSFDNANWNANLPDRAFSCGVVTGCTQTYLAFPFQIFGGPIALTAGTVTITSLPFSSATSYFCSAGDTTTNTNAVTVSAYTSGSSVTFAGTGTDTIRYICFGS